MNFSEWILGKFAEWERDQPRRQSYSAFARYLEVKQTTLSAWINGGIIPSYEKAGLIADKLGDEVYLILGYEPPGSTVSAFPFAVRSALESAMSRITAAGLDADSPDAQRIFDDAMIALGYRKISNLDDESSA